ncbi:hypothetical protein KFK09_021074 [Dendrobium nobile]|uniref:Uncharacterized protein n=1 Tax=Dendrobium nobile TaxID=94219 RepID=A0A8T3AMQ9_DENNO|nr:hypothetical protein KFK09_021074 [Dendrobium nobile]
MAHYTVLYLITCNLFMQLAMARQYSMAFELTENIQLREPFMANPPSSILAAMEPQLMAAAPVLSTHYKHRSFDKSMAGGEVIIGGLATAIFLVVFCYIRITRKRGEDGKL